jgi:hypothetical protein
MNASPDYAAEAARQYLSLSPVPGGGAVYGQPGGANAFPGPLTPVMTNLQGNGPVSPTGSYGVSPFGVVPGFPLVVSRTERGSSLHRGLGLTRLVQPRPRS